MSNTLQTNDMEDTVKSMIGHKIIMAGYKPENEGVFTLLLDDGRVIQFSATGDDMTYVYIMEEAPTLNKIT